MLVLDFGFGEDHLSILVFVDILYRLNARRHLCYIVK